jgi:uncharacterized protein (DUF2141 family)
VRRGAIVIAVVVGQLLVSSTARAQEDGATIRFVVSGLDSDEGHVLCALFDSERTWLTEDRLQTSRVGISGGRAVCRFDDVPPGVYAITAFHDENDDQRLDRGLLGIPREPYCMSRNARRAFAAPRFADASFQHLRGDLTLQARMR